MKKLALLSLLITSVLFGYSQSQRLVLLEHFTQASCGPCAQINPTIHSRLVANADKMTSINYHVNWPGVDPMNAHNPGDVSTRVSLYGVSAVPHSVLDGSIYSGSPQGWLNNMSIVNNRYAVPSPFSLSINQELSATNDTLFVTMLVHATDTVTGNATAYLAVIEKYIHFNSPPGSNGEKDFYNVFKKFLPSKTGVSLPTPLYPGDYVILQSYWVLANVYNLDQLSVIGFIQSPTTKEVFQSANLQPMPISAVYDADVEATRISNAMDRTCETSYSPVLKIRNNGNDALTNLTLKYQVNDGAVQTYEWSGNMGFLDINELNLPEINYTLQDTNVLKIYVDQVNLGLDEYTKNDTITQVFYNAHQMGHNVQLKLRTDDSPEETTWVIKNSDGENVAAGGPYTQANTLVTENIYIEHSDCYDFYMYDAGGNGLCCGNGSGFFRLAAPSGNPIIAQGTQFGTEVWAQFEVYIVGTTNIGLGTDFKVYPNPASDKFMIEVSSGNLEYKVSVVNQIGQRVFETTGTDSKIEVATDSWPSGLYLISVESANGVKIQKLNILK